MEKLYTKKELDKEFYWGIVIGLTIGFASACVIIYYTFF